MGIWEVSFCIFLNNFCHPFLESLFYAIAQEMVSFTRVSTHPNLHIQLFERIWCDKFFLYLNVMGQPLPLFLAFFLMHYFDLYEFSKCVGHCFADPFVCVFFLMEKVQRTRVVFYFTLHDSPDKV